MATKAKMAAPPRRKMSAKSGGRTVIGDDGEAAEPVTTGVTDPKPENQEAADVDRS